MAKKSSKASTTGTKTKRRTSTTDPAPPQGWEAIEDFPEPAAGDEFDAVATLRELVRIEVRAGFNGPRRAMQNVVESLRDELAPEEVRRLARPLFKEERTLLEAERETWPEVTDCDRLDAAFAELESRGILARQDYWCCGTCGCAAIDDEIAAIRRRKRPVRGYTFYHNQDTESAVEGHGLFLNYGAAEWEEKACVAIGREVAKTLRAHGLKVTWNGDLDQRIRVRVDWKRRGEARKVSRGGRDRAARRG